MAKAARRISYSHSVNVHKLCITGGAASGKSSALLRLEREGYTTLDSSCLAARLLLSNRPLWRLFSDWALAQGFPQQALADRYSVAKSLPYLRLLSQNALSTGGQPMPEAVQAFFSVQLRKEVSQFLFSPSGSLVRVVEDPLVFETDTQHLYDEIWSLQSNLQTQQQRLELAGLLPRNHLSLFVKEATVPPEATAYSSKKRLIICNEASWQSFHEELNYQVRHLRQHLLFSRHFS